MRKFKTWRDPHGAGYSTCRPREIEIHEGLTVFVGCNGAGKSTLLNNIQWCLEDEGIPVRMFDNLNDGGGFSLSYALFNEDFGVASALMTASEGESIRIRFGQHANKLKNFIANGKYRKGDRQERVAEAFDEYLGVTRETKSASDERWLLFDATDSGLSIDSVIDIKTFFKLIEADAKEYNVSLYIIVAANEYELANGEDCFDVNKGKYIRFKDYENYKKFILKNREAKEKRITKAIEKEESKKLKNNSKL